jgi:hypothetical protein
MKASLEERALEVGGDIQDAEGAFGVVVPPQAGAPEEQWVASAAVGPEPLTRAPRDRKVDRVQLGGWIGMRLRAAHGWLLPALAMQGEVDRLVSEVYII